MVDRKELKETLKAKKISTETAAAYMGLAPSTLYRKLRPNGIKFTVRDVESLCELLKLSKKAREEIFFADKQA